jgi:hypothetical protein
MMSDTPFLARFAIPLPAATRSEKICYDPVRQVSRVFVDGDWVDAIDATKVNLPSTRVTKVDRETTDDQ